jgi:hypothetical protein
MTGPCCGEIDQTRASRASAKTAHQNIRIFKAFMFTPVV